MCCRGCLASLRFLFNVYFRRLDVTAADSGPVHLPEAECQGVMRHLVVKFRIWQNALKPSRLQMQRRSRAKMMTSHFLPHCIISLASSHTNDQIVLWLCLLSGHPLLLLVIFDDKSNYQSCHSDVFACKFRAEHEKQVATSGFIKSLFCWGRFLDRKGPFHVTDGQCVHPGCFTAAVHPFGTKQMFSLGDNHDLSKQITSPPRGQPAVPKEPGLYVSGKVTLSLLPGQM